MELLSLWVIRDCSNDRTALSIMASGLVFTISFISLSYRFFLHVEIPKEKDGWQTQPAILMGRG
jgi:hypothetical protein